MRGGLVMRYGGSRASAKEVLHSGWGHIKMRAMVRGALVQ